jgi:pimeloyl-ACP methyl ester carboxylesterase
MPYVERPAGRAYYAVAGGPETAAPAILIHGAGGSHLDWPPALRRLPGRLTLALDLPGHGRSDRPGQPSVAGYADWTLDTLDVLSIPAVAGHPLLLIGHSMGAGIALEMARSAPAQVAGLILIGAGARLPVPPALLEAADPADGMADWAYGPAASVELRRIGRQRLALLDAAILREDLRACAGFDLRGRLGGVGAPALLVVGAADRLTPPALAEELRAELPAAELVCIEGAGHMVTFERPAEVMAALRQFLERIRPPGE